MWLSKSTLGHVNIATLCTVHCREYLHWICPLFLFEVPCVRFFHILGATVGILSAWKRSQTRLTSSLIQPIVALAAFATRIGNALVASQLVMRRVVRLYAILWRQVSISCLSTPPCSPHSSIRWVVATTVAYKKFTKGHYLVLTQGAAAVCGRVHGREAEHQNHVRRAHTWCLEH